MSTHTKNGISVIPPVGGIMAYMGTSSPDGWIICDGVAVINTDGRYDELIQLNIGTWSDNYYTPPDLKGRFLYGTTSVGVTGVIGGTSSIDLEHSHTQQAGTTASLTVPNYNNVATTTNNSGSSAGIWAWETGTQPEITLSNNNPETDKSLSNETSILPPYYSVTYILKY
jgi:microcystin-dependent protein